MTIDKSKLLPCPFCGKRPVVQERKGIMSASVGCDCAASPCVLSLDIALAKAIWNARASSRPPAVPDIRKALEDALAMLGAPTDGIETLGDRDIVKHTVAIQGWKLKQLHAALQAVPAEVGEIRELLVEAQRHVADLAALPCEAVGPENAESCSCDPCRARSLNERIDFALKASGEE